MTDIEILESTYFDKCTIKRKEKIKNPITGVTETKEVIIVENAKCALVSVTPVIGFFIFSFLLIVHLSK